MKVCAPAGLVAALLFVVSANAEQGQSAPEGEVTEVGADPPTKLPPAPHPAAPYSLPWQLRPAMPVTVLRFDTALAVYDAEGEGRALTTVGTVLAAYNLAPTFSLLLRGALVHDDQAAGSLALSNPLVGGIYGLRFGDFRVGAFLGVALPFGAGGGDAPDPERAAAMRAAVLARSAMDNALFAVNDLTVVPGIDVAFVRGGWTIQAEATVLQLTRVRGAEVQPDARRTNFTSGLHVGYFVLGNLTVSGEVRYQRWLSNPMAVLVPGGTPLRDTASAAAGLRYHQPLGPEVWLRPGASFGWGLDAPMTTRRYRIVQIDVPFVF